MPHVDMRDVIADLCDGDEQAKRTIFGCNNLARSITVEQMCTWHIDHIYDNFQEALDLRNSIGTAL